MKKLLIMATLLASSSLLVGCGTTAKPINDAPTSITKNPDVIQATGTINTITASDKRTSEIKALVEKRKKELANETGNKKELNQNDIQLLESVLAEMTKK